MGDDEAGKLFIGGVDKDTSKDDFRAFFEEKGELTDWVLMKDPVTIGRNRGFGFVTYKDPEVAKKVLNSGPLILNGKKLDPKPCQKREEQRKQNDREGGAEPDSPNKLFVGGIAQGSTKESIEAAFSSYGKVLFIQLMTDRNTGNHRGFGFVTFESPEPVEMLRKQRFVQCDDKTVECKPAESRYRFQGPGGGGGGGGRGGQWGSGGHSGGNWQGPQGGQGDYGYQSGGWGGQPAMGGMWGQQPQMGSYGNQGGYGQQASNSWGPGYGGGYGGQTNTGYGGGGGRGGQWGSGGHSGGNWQGPQGGQGDYGYQSGGWGGQPAMGSYGNQGGYGQQASNSWGPGYGGGYGGQTNTGYGGGYGQPPYGNQYNAQGNYGASQTYSGGYGGGYGTPAPQQAGQYGAQGAAGGYNQGGYGTGYSNSNSYQQPPAANTGSDPNSSGGPMPASYGQRMGNNAQQYHPYRR
ncbi:Heterogeneous nuclear ribonucleoprotein 27C [Holothuria leucospilota]|uniref:Heterogeneous nuclear ribonucleoprotein 27C n=1 Tax=Holothuria leucospilota TaxID=206669 RepID=A0A9Q1BNZ4_HOLLE|nr:Heterogeneous nuclear ribonucleoprotein 27C [Holothuria leucospilota]